MGSVWITGCNSYETTGVVHLLKDSGISAGLLRSGVRFRTGDALVICFSSAPLLGWWRYLKITQWLAQRYDIRLIVLCPDEVYRTGVICGRNVLTVNGERGRVCLSRSLYQAVQNCLPEEILESHRECMKLSFLESASQVLQILPIRESDDSTIRKAYQKRDLLVQRLGFASLMTLKVFMAGFC